MSLRPSECARGMFDNFRNLVCIIIGLVVAVLTMATGGIASMDSRHHHRRLFIGSTQVGNSTNATAGRLAKLSGQFSWFSPLAVLIVLVVAMVGILVFLGLSNRKKRKDTKSKDKNRNNAPTNKNVHRKSSKAVHSSKTRATKSSPTGKPSTVSPSSPKVSASPNQVHNLNKDLSQLISMFNRILKEFRKIMFVVLEKRLRQKYIELKADLEKVKKELNDAQNNNNKGAHDLYGRLDRKLGHMDVALQELKASGGSARPVTEQIGAVQSVAKRSDQPTKLKSVPASQVTESELQSTSGVEEEESSVMLVPRLDLSSKDRDEKKEGQNGQRK